MAIKHIEELKFKQTLFALIYGHTGNGKTTLALSGDPNTLLIDTDGGIDRINEEHLMTAGFIQVQSYAEILSDLQYAGKYNVIVIDTLGKLIEFMAVDIMNQSEKNSNGFGSLSMKGWGILNTTFKDFCLRIRRMGKHLIFVAHTIAEKNKDDIKYIPDVRANNFNSLASNLDLIGYMSCIGSERTLSFTPTSDHEGKNSGFDNIIKIPTLSAGVPNDFFAKHILSKHFDNLSKKEKKSAEVREKLNEIDVMLSFVNSPASADEFCKQIKEMEHIGTSLQYAKTKFKAKVKELNLQLNKDTGLYEEVA